MDRSSESSSAAKMGDEHKEPGKFPPTSKPRRAKRNIMLENFQKPEPPYGPYTYPAKPFFFYGSLMDPVRLQEVLQLPEPPALKPARVLYCKTKLWGQYPALVNGRPGDYIDGMAWVVETEEQERMLERYETDVYRLRGIQITIDGKHVTGKTFKWADDPAELTEGTWSLEEWKKGVEEEMESHFRPVED